MDKQPLGVDFGTSTTLIATDLGQTVPIGKTRPWMPSLAAWDEGVGWAVGEDAETRARTIKSIKNWITLGGDHPDIIDGIEPTEAIHRILKEAQVRANRDIPFAEHQVRLGCPAMWTREQRLLLAETAVEAGWNVDVDHMVDEPIAAGIAWLWGKTSGALRHSKAQTDLRPGKLLVVDFGGGTVDVALMQLEAVSGSGPSGPEFAITVLTARGMAGAGDEIDQRVATRLSQLWAEEGIDPEDFMTPLGQRLLNLAARDVKERLSSAGVAHAMMGPPLNHIPAMRVPREDLNEILRPLLDDTLALAELALRDAQLKSNALPGLVKSMPSKELASDVEYVLLAGGMSRIPALKEHFQARYPKADVVDADEADPTQAIAKGLGSNEAFESINLHRPALDLVLEWETYAGARGEEVLYPAFTPLYTQAAVFANGTLAYEYQASRVPDRVKSARLLVRTPGSHTVPIEIKGKKGLSLDLNLVGWQDVRLKIRPNGDIYFMNGRRRMKFRVVSWPQIHFGSQRHRTVQKTLEMQVDEVGPWIDEEFKYPHK